MTLATGLTWAIAGLSTAGVIARPMRWPEWIWAATGALLLVVIGLMPVAAAVGAIGEGLDLYLFLAGMMLLSEATRTHGVFDWVAVSAVNLAAGSRARLFGLVYAAGVLVTTLMSNDATAVVLTPAVFAAAKKAKADPLPLLFACALVANAASFVLPISNPANLVLYGGRMPPLGEWLRSFALPSVVSVTVTFAALRWLERERLTAGCESGLPRAALTTGGKFALLCLIATALLLVTASWFDRPLGLPTALAGAATALGASSVTRRSPLALARNVSWSVLPLVAGLFVLVGALDRTGVVREVGAWLRTAADHPVGGAALAGSALAIVANLVNNLPAGLLAGAAIQQTQSPREIVDALLIGVDLGPNLSVTGSLATILWLQVIRREGEDVSFLAFLKIGAVAMPLALAGALAARLLTA